MLTSRLPASDFGNPTTGAPFTTTTARRTRIFPPPDRCHLASVQPARRTAGTPGRQEDHRSVAVGQLTDDSLELRQAGRSDLARAFRCAGRANAAWCKRSRVRGLSWRSFSQSAAKPPKVAAAGLLFRWAGRTHVPASSLPRSTCSQPLASSKVSNVEDGRCNRRSGPA